MSSIFPSNSGLIYTSCRECVRQANQRGATGGPLSHFGCMFDKNSNPVAKEPEFAFPPSCPGCRQFDEDAMACKKAEQLCQPAHEPGAPRAHTCEKFGSY
jgi:hypothetical protein